MRARKRSNRIVQGSILCFVAMAGVVAYEILRPKPNVVLIVVDSLRADAISDAIGAAKTPNIDALAADGVLFRKAFAHSPSTLPANAALLSGKLPYQTLVVDNEQSISRDVPLLTTQLATSGYETRAVVGHSEMWVPRGERALDRSFGEYRQGEREISTAGEVNDHALSMLEELVDEEPFFLFAHYADPHEPYNANGFVTHEAEILLDGELLETVTTSELAFFDREVRLDPGLHVFEIRSNHAFDVRRFDCDGPTEMKVDVRKGDLHQVDKDFGVAIHNETDGMISASISTWICDAPSTTESRHRYRREVENVDRAIGELVAELKERGVYDNTLIVLTSNHGESLGEHGTTGHDVTLYDEVLSIPLIIKTPKTSPLRGALEDRRDSIARQIDIAPTIFELAKLSAEPTTGTSLTRSTKRVILAETHEPLAPRTLFGMRDERYKLIYDAKQNQFEFYDLAQDPTELDSVFSVQGHLRQDWQDELKRLASGFSGSIAASERKPTTSEAGLIRR